MSLINEALKKAQRVRTEEPADPSAPPAAAEAQVPPARITKRGKATSANTMVLIGSGAIVLIVLSVVLTVFLLNRPAAPAPTASAAPAAAPKATPPVVETPVAPIVGPVIAPPVTPTPAPTSTETPPTSTATQVASASTSTPTTPPPTTPSPTPAATETPPAPVVAVAPAPIVPTTPPPPPEPDERITAFVDNIKVAGIRSSGNESRVLMNDRVFRVNDLVDRTLGVRLIKVGADNLVFSDAKGATYVKNF